MKNVKNVGGKPRPQPRGKEEGISKKPKRKARRDQISCRQISYFQKHSDRLWIPKAHVRAITRHCVNAHQDAQTGQIRVSPEAELMLGDIMQATIVTDYERANLLAIHGGRITVMEKDVAMQNKIRD